MVGVIGVTGDPVTRSAQGREKDSAQQRNWKSVREQQRDTEFNCKRESALSRNAMVSFEASTEMKSDNNFRKLLDYSHMIAYLHLPKNLHPDYICHHPQIDRDLQDATVLIVYLVGAQGFEQDLKSDEIIGQLWLANFHNKEINQITNVVFMGMGEPLLNYDAVLESAKIMKDPHSYGLSRKRITISTSGIVPNILKLSQDIDV